MVCVIRLGCQEGWACVCDRLIAIAGKYPRVNSSLDMNAEKCRELFASGSSRRLKQSGLSTKKKKGRGAAHFRFHY